MALRWLFAALIKSDSNAAALAYGTIIAAKGRKEAIALASEEFFRSRDLSDPQTNADKIDVLALINGIRAPIV